MKRISIIIFCLAALFATSSRVSAKSGIIPTYRSFVLWIEGNDSVYGEGRALMLNCVAPDSSVSIAVRHQDWNNKALDYKDNIMKPWHTIMSTHRGILTSLDNGKANIEALDLIRSHRGDMQAASDINAMNEATEHLTMDLNSQYLISNNSNEEIVINDMNRGTTWYIPAGMFLIMDMGKLPQISLLRICNANAAKPQVKYAYIGSGSFSMKYTLAYECDDYWIFNLSELVTVNAPVNTIPALIGLKDDALRTRYIQCDKQTFEEKEVPENVVYQLSHKKK